MKDDSKNSTTCQTPVYFSVYVLWCSKTDMHYIGVTGQKNVYKRIYQHKYGKLFVDREIQRIGWEHWDWWIVESHVPSNLISEREQYWVNFFGSLHPNGYNRTIGGIKHFKHSEATCEQISTTQLGRPGYWAGKKRPDFSGENHPLYGRHHTQETRDKMKESHLGKKRAPFTEEHIANLSKAKMGEKNPNYGKPTWNSGIPCTNDAKRKIRQKLTDKKRPDQSERMKGENNPNFGKPLSEKTKAILREKALARWAAKRAAKEAQETP